MITDFSAERAFARANEQLGEHYGISLPVSTIRTITLHHGDNMYQSQQQVPCDTNQTQLEPGVGIIIAETDGCMVPVMEPSDESRDRRKGKNLLWKEVRLNLAHAHNNSEIFFSGAFSGGVKTTGEQLKQCVKRTGFGYQSHVHAVGDGAPWIADQVTQQFSSQGSYLIDLYHLCEYLSKASATCSDNPSTWVEQQKTHLKEGRLEQVITALKPWSEASHIKNEDAPVRACLRYIQNRPGQFEYAAAIEQSLPIGSGEIESAHRYVVQKRLKISGAWWRAANVDNMLSLSLNRANGEWCDYWCEQQAA